MPHIRRLNEQHLAYFNRTQCTSDVGTATQRWRNYAGQNNRCKLNALYTVDGKPMCERHAGAVLIKHALIEEDSDNG